MVAERDQAGADFIEDVLRWAAIARASRQKIGKALLGEAAAAGTAQAVSPFDPLLFEVQGQTPDLALVVPHPMAGHALASSGASQPISLSADCSSSRGRPMTLL